MSIVIKNLGQTDYASVFSQMKAFTTSRQEITVDELWLTQHHPVFTQGQAGKPEHILSVKDIPIIQSDRGGQVTYHGPGQVVLYLLVNIRRRGIAVRQMVSLIEDSVVALLDAISLTAFTKKNSPGVYVNIDNMEHKIASLGLRIKNGCTYHGVAVNVSMDLSPFSDINPCGYKGLAVTQIVDSISVERWKSVEQVGNNLANIMREKIEAFSIATE
ncbi:MAG: lipoyl(octanoyl) transferase LipB [Ostreibacterium sp.]